MKVVATTPSFGKFHDDIEKTLKNKGMELIYLVPYKRDDLLKHIHDTEVLVVGVEKMDEEIINQADSLKMIAKHGVGVDNIDLEAASKKGVSVTNVPDKNNDAVADLAFGLMLSNARSIVQAHNTTKNDEWIRFDGRSVWGKTLGIIGLGAIGKSVAKRANGFSMNILGYDLNEPDLDEKELNINRVSLEELYEQSDYITLHVPLDKDTYKMIGKHELESMKETAILINTARGGLIDEDALYSALKNQSILSAGIDVFEEEPVKNKKLLSLNNIIVTPHMAAFTYESGYLISEIIIDNIVNLLEKKEVENIVWGSH